MRKQPTDQQRLRGEVADALAKAGGDPPPSDLKPYQMVHIHYVRQYMEVEFHPDAFSTALPFAYDFENIIDDFVFMCFMVGNDFLPHLPSLSIREGAIDMLMYLYRKHLPSIGSCVLPHRCGTRWRGGMAQLLHCFGLPASANFALHGVHRVDASSHRTPPTTQIPY